MTYEIRKATHNDEPWSRHDSALNQLRRLDRLVFCVFDGLGTRHATACVEMFRRVDAPSIFDANLLLLYLQHSDLPDTEYTALINAACEAAARHEVQRVYLARGASDAMRQHAFLAGFKIEASLSGNAYSTRIVRVLSP